MMELSLTGCRHGGASLARTILHWQKYYKTNCWASCGFFNIAGEFHEC